MSVDKLKISQFKLALGGLTSKAFPPKMYYKKKKKLIKKRKSLHK